MTMNSFTWCDLSTYDLAKACAFYKAVLGWSDHRLPSAQQGDDYTMLYSQSDGAAGVYTMPTLFQNINMPSFWMPYIRVEAIGQSVDLAIRLGAKCEIEPTPLDADSSYALIRDPSGAGFTLYQGPDLGGLDPSARHGHMCWNELHIPTFETVEPFYAELFGWVIATDPMVSHRKLIQSPSGESIASMLQVDEATKGSKNYWSIAFATNQIDDSLQAVTNNGGTILMQPDGPLGFAMAADNQNAMFCLTYARS